MILQQRAGTTSALNPHINNTLRPDVISVPAALPLAVLLIRSVAKAERWMTPRPLIFKLQLGVYNDSFFLIAFHLLCFFFLFLAGHACSAGRHTLAKTEIKLCGFPCFRPGRWFLSLASVMVMWGSVWLCVWIFVCCKCMGGKKKREVHIVAQKRIAALKKYLHQWNFWKVSHFTIWNFMYYIGMKQCMLVN